MNAVVGFVVVIALIALPIASASGQQPATSQGGSSQPSQPTTQYPAAQQPSQQPSQPSATPSTTSGVYDGAGLLVASDSLLGTKVRDHQGKDIGQISKLLIDAKQGKVTSAIIKQGGALGFGAKEISVPWDVLKLQRGQDQELIVTLQQPLLEQAPAAQHEQRDRDRQPPAASPQTSGQEKRHDEQRKQ